MRRVRALVGLFVAVCASSSHADGPPRTPHLHWTLDDRLNVGDGTNVGAVVQGDVLTVEIDTNQRFASSTRAQNGDPFFGQSSPSVTIDSTNGATETGNVATFKTTAPHGLDAGDVVTVSGVTVSGYDGTFKVATVPSPTTFTTSLPAGGLAASGNGKVQGPTVIAMPVGLKHFVLATNGNGWIMDDGQCVAGEILTKSAAAIECVSDPTLSKDLANWPRTAAGVPALSPPVWRCSAPKPFVTLGGVHAVHLMRRVPAPPAAKAVGKKPESYKCEHSWVLRADDDLAVESVVVTSTIGTTRVSLAATLTDGIWSVEAPLKESGAARVSVAVKYHSGFTNATELAAFEVQPVDTHLLVRIQPELLATKNMRTVNLGVAITPVTRKFFASGPWHDCSGSLCIMNGINPSAVARFTGDNSLLQFGVGVSIFFNQSMLMNAGILFGSLDSTQYWSPTPNFFFGFAIDPALLIEARTAGK